MRRIDASPVAPRSRSGRPAPSRRIAGGVVRVGGQRLTSFGVVLLFATVVALGVPRQDADVTLLGIAFILAGVLLVVGVVAPAVAVRSVRVDARSPPLGTVGDDLAITVSVERARGGAEVRVLDPVGEWHRVKGDTTGELVHRADRRGSFPLLRLEVRVTGPLDISAAHRVHDVELARVVDIGPRPTEVDLVAAPAPSAALGVPTPTASLAGDVVRAVRPYVSGDPAHLVHWPTSARTGGLVVRELEPPGRCRLAVVVDLRGLGADTEAVASVACGVAHRALEQGSEVVVLTAEALGPAEGQVRSRAQVGRRLARAVAGPPPSPPEGWPVLDVGAWWRQRSSWEPPPVGAPVTMVLAPVPEGDR